MGTRAPICCPAATSLAGEKRRAAEPEEDEPSARGCCAEIDKAAGGTRAARDTGERDLSHGGLRPGGFLNSAPEELRIGLMG